MTAVKTDWNTFLFDQPEAALAANNQHVLGEVGKYLVDKAGLPT